MRWEGIAGEAHAALLTSLEGHSDDRQLDEANSYYWLCAYAQNVHAAERAANGSTLLDAIYREQLGLADGLVCVVDPSAHLATRAWPAFEICLCITINNERHSAVRAQDSSKGHGNAAQGTQQLLLDVYTCYEHAPPAARGSPNGTKSGEALVAQGTRNAVGLSDGLASRDDDNPRAKECREACFPTALLTKLLTLRVERGMTSSEDDRRYILNSLAQRSDTCAIPLPSHSAYENANVEIRAHIAARALGRCARAGGGTLDSCLASLRRAQSVRQLEASFAEAELSEAVISNIINSLPTSLETLALTDCASLCTPGTIARLDRLPQLRSLSLEGCALTKLPDALVALDNLRFLNLTDCRELLALPDTLGSHAKLVKLVLFGCRSLEQLPSTISLLAKLEVLDVRQCTDLCSIPDLSDLQYLRNVGKVLGDGPLFEQWERRGRKAIRGTTVSSRRKRAQMQWKRSSSNVKCAQRTWASALYGQKLASALGAAAPDSLANAEPQLTLDSQASP